MLTFAISVALLMAVLSAAATWAKREAARRRAVAEHYRQLEFDDVEEVAGHARDHR